MEVNEKYVLRASPHNLTPDLLDRQRRDAQVVLRLEIHPELRGVAEVLRQAKRRIRRYPVALHDLIDPATGGGSKAIHQRGGR